jgi:DNA replication protein DnaC
MNNKATMEKMQLMRLHGMLKAFRVTMESGVKKKFTADEMVGHLIDAEWDERENRKLERLLKGAKFRYQSAIEEIDFSINRNLDKNRILRLSDCSWIRGKENIIITGPTGVGKSFIATALGHQACMYGYKVIYYNCLKFFSQMRYWQADGSYIKEMKKIGKAELLILDDFGLEILDKANRISLLEILEDRVGKCSTIIVSQLPENKWHEIIGDETIADAICDRVLHNSYKIKMKGESMRKAQKRK